MMKKALINIDYTVDFVADNGALTCGKPGQDIERAIVQVTEDFISNGEFVVFAIDTHQKDDNYHPESKLFPPHNIDGTKGRELFGRLKELYENNKQIRLGQIELIYVSVFVVFFIPTYFY